MLGNPTYTLTKDNRNAFSGEQPMPIRRLTFCLFALFGMLPAIAFAQSPPKAEAPPPTASVAGRVTLDGQPVAGARVFLLSKVSFDKPLAGTATDAAGRFRIGGLPDGTVMFWVARGADVSENDGEAGMGKSVTLEPGEAVEDVELRLRPGGVITGRVTDAENRPVIGQTISIRQLRKNPRTGEEEPGGPGSFFFYNRIKYQTDDRGVYRVFGLPPGRYIVGVGDIKIAGQTNFNLGGRNTVPGTFHPKTTEWKEAAVIDLAAGETEEKCDISVGRPARNVTIAGKVVDDETGAPVAKLAVGLVSAEPGGSMGSFSGFSDARGEFLLTNVKPGAYQIQILSLIQSSDYVGDPMPIEVRDDDLKDVTIRVKRGVTVSGRIELDGKPETVRFDEQTIGIAATGMSPGQLPNSRSSKVAPDGSFVITGVKPNTTYFINLFQPKARQENLRILTLRRAGANLPAIRLEVGAESVTDLQIIAVRALGKLRGEIRFVGGTPDKSIQYVVVARLEGPSSNIEGYGVADERGRFLIEDLTAGTYTLKVWVTRYGQGRTPVKLASPQTATIPETGDGAVVLTVDLSNQSESKPQ